MRSKGIGKYEDARRLNGEDFWNLVRTSISQEPFEYFKDRIKGSHYGGYSIQNYHKEKLCLNDTRFTERKGLDHYVLLEGETIFHIRTSGTHQSARGEEIWQC